MDELEWLLYDGGFSDAYGRIKTVLTVYRRGGGLGPVVVVAIRTYVHLPQRLVGCSCHYLLC